MPRVSQVGIKRMSRTVARSFKRRRRSNKSLPEFPVLDPAAWRSVFEAVRATAPRLGPCSMELHEESFARIRSLLPQVKIRRVFTSRNANQLQLPIGAPLIQDAPWRLSIGMPEGDMDPQILSADDRRRMNRDAVHATCPQCPCS